MMTKYIFITALTICSFPSLDAQRMDFSQVIPQMDEKPEDFEQYLVQLAWLNSPESKAAYDALDLKNHQLKASRRSWLNNVFLSFGILPGESILSTDPGTGIDDVFNQTRYNIGLGISLGGIAQLNNTVNVSKEEIEIAQEGIHLKMLEIRAKVKERYTAYLSALEVVGLRREAEADAKAHFTLVSELFKNDKATHTDFSTATSFYYDAREALIKARGTLDVATILLEEIIGVSIDAATMSFQQ